MSTLNVDKVDPNTGTTLEIGSSGDTVSLPSGATLDISASTLTPPATMPASSGINFTALNATNLGSGTVPTARLGTGTASSSTVLYGDQTYKAEPGGGKVLQVTQGTSTTQTIHNTISTFTASGISGTITPSSTDSKVFVVCWFLANVAYNPSAVAGGSLKIYKDVGGGGYSALWPAALGLQFTIAGASGEIGKRGYQSISYLDSPSTTSAITYKIYGAAGPSGYGNITTSSDSSSSSVVMFEIDGS